MKTILLLAACAAALSGCAGTQIAVRAHSDRSSSTGARTYAFADDSGAASGDRREDFVSAVGHRLAELGFTSVPAPAARYRIALSQETRPASVGIAYTDCADGAPCGAPSVAPGFEWPGATPYLHSLTLRFFDAKDGREAYKVSAAKRDRDRDVKRDIDDLVAGALARFPFDDRDGGTGDLAATSDWKVTLNKPQADGAPRVTGIAPLKH
ncbi:DUF4136 domain-containing protein [Trinickia sp. NRRL B-1857]|uniref:DUF4136 domain-containing protein n=1 Tax=Trinickia sp. NRRL B-1857 TaxID=3162879 RepID=UPI003D2A33F8